MRRFIWRSRRSLSKAICNSGLPGWKTPSGNTVRREAEFYAGLADALDRLAGPAGALPWYQEAVRHAPGSAGMLRRLGSARDAVRTIAAG